MVKRRRVGPTAGRRRNRPPAGRRLVAALALVLVAGCSSNPPEVCGGGFCTGPAHTYTTWDDLVFVLTWVGIVPVPPGTADGPARITKPVKPAPPRTRGGS
jgi:hypothetical protein